MLFSIIVSLQDVFGSMTVWGRISSSEENIPIQLNIEFILNIVIQLLQIGLIGIILFAIGKKTNYKRLPNYFIWQGGIGISGALISIINRATLLVSQSESVVNLLGEFILITALNVGVSAIFYNYFKKSQRVYIYMHGLSEFDNVSTTLEN